MRSYKEERDCPNCGGLVIVDVGPGVRVKCEGCGETVINQ